MLVLGVFFLITVIETPEGFGRMAGLTAVMGYMVGIPGRNFANGYLVNVLVVCAAAPVLSALTIAGAIIGCLPCSSWRRFLELETLFAPAARDIPKRGVACARRQSARVGIG